MLYPGVGTFVLIRPAQTFYERIKLEYAASGLAPAVLLTVLLAVGLALVAENDVLASVVGWALLLNVMGSAGDMLMMRKLVPYNPRVTIFEDTGEGFVAYGPASGFELQ